MGSLSFIQALIALVIMFVRLPVRKWTNDQIIIMDKCTEKLKKLPHNSVFDIFGLSRKSPKNSKQK